MPNPGDVVVVSNCPCCGSSSSSSGGCNTCDPIPACWSDSYVVTFSGVTNFTCTNCLQVNGSHTLIHSAKNAPYNLNGEDQCLWYYRFPTSICGTLITEMVLSISGNVGNYSYGLQVYAGTSASPLVTYSGTSTNCNGCTMSVITGNTGCGWNFASTVTVSGTGTMAAVPCCACCCSRVVGGVESACGNCIISKTSLDVVTTCYAACAISPKIVSTLTVVAGGVTETLTGDSTDCTKWYNHGELSPFQTSAILLNNQFTFFYVKSTSPLCIYTATGVPCINGQTFTWNVSPPGTGCAATLTGKVSW